MNEKMTCAMCGAELPETRDAEGDSTTKCPKCGSVLVTLEISDDVFQRIEAYAKETGISPDQAINQALRNWLTEEGKHE